MKEKKHTQDGLARANASIIPLIGHRGNIRASAWSPDGAAILTGSEDGTALLWDLDTERETRRFEQKSDVTAVAWSPDGKRFLIGCADGTTTLRDSKRRVGQAKRGPPLGVRDRKVGQAQAHRSSFDTPHRLVNHTCLNTLMELPHANGGPRFA
jgi:WD40 repeat protein